VDVFSLGVLMAELFMGGVRPYPDLSPNDIPNAVARGARPSFPSYVPAHYRCAYR
jgi:hypothetical protein